MNKSIFNSTFWFGSALFSIIAFLILLYIPDLYLEKYQTSAYMESGQIGDIIGGTTNPIIAIGAAFLTFLAFWMQYKANRQQRDDISLERFESNLYEMLHLHRENLFDLSCGSKKGRLAMVLFCYKLKLLYFIINSIIDKLFKEDKQLFENYCNKNEYDEIDAKTIIAYNLFFYGANFSLVFDDNSDERKLYNKLAGIIENIENKLFCICPKSSQYDDSLVEKSIKNVQYYLNCDTTEYWFPDLINIPDSLLCGYNDKLGVYLRQLYQIVKFVALKEGITEDEKYQYMRIVRAQLSDYEQILLYYNSLTQIGKAWNEQLLASDLLFSSEISNKIYSCIYQSKTHWKNSKGLAKRRYKELGTNILWNSVRSYYIKMKREWRNPSLTINPSLKNDFWKLNMGLIARFRLIKNIPVSFQMFGYLPEAKYFFEIISYYNHSDNFFEVKNAYLYFHGK